MIKRTDLGTPYLTEPHVAVVSRTQPLIENAQLFLESYGLGYEAYLDDTTLLGWAEEICKFSGQLDYLSFGEARTYNKDAQKYLDRIKSEAHGSVLEHASFGVLCWGVSRSCTHEIVRHRAGFSYSQVSQRYVGENAVRFVERPEVQTSEELHLDFEDLIDNALSLYKHMCGRLEEAYRGDLQGTELRKQVRQAARSVLPNCTEAPILITANVRAWRHFLEMRCSMYAEVEIRALAYQIYLELLKYAPMLFNDYTPIDYGTGPHLDTEWRKV
jgi:thymidylate synthase (FAD)